MHKDHTLLLDHPIVVRVDKAKDGGVFGEVIGEIVFYTDGELEDALASFVCHSIGPCPRSDDLFGEWSLGVTLVWDTDV